MTHKPSSKNAQPGVEHCRRCGRPKRASKLEHSTIGPVCRTCARVLADTQERQHGANDDTRP